MACTAVTLSIIQGTTTQVTYTVTDSAGDPLAMTGVTGKIRASLTPGASTILDLSSYLTIPSSGTVSLEIPSSITDALVQDNGPGPLPYDILITLADDSVVQLVRGNAVLSYSATELT